MRRIIHIMLGGGLNFDNIAVIKAHTPGCDYHFGTAVREDNSAFGDIDMEKLQKLVKLVRPLQIDIFRPSLIGMDFFRFEAIQANFPMV